MLPKVFSSMNAIQAGLISDHDVDVILDAASRVARPARLVGGTSTSLETIDTVLDYRLVDGNAVEEHVPVLHNLYRDEFRAIAERVFDVQLQLSPHVLNGVNINVLEGSGGRYEWHYDSNPFTGLLVLTDVSQVTGGRLLFGQDEDDRVSLSMSRGDLLFFDARQAAHSVEPLRHDFLRASVPMNYYAKGEAVVRPADLDDSLYS